MDKKVQNYIELIQDGVLRAQNAIRDIEVEKIWLIEDLNWNVYDVDVWMFWWGWFLLKKRNRKLAEAMRVYCEDNGKHIRYSDYHKALYVWLYRCREYDKIRAFYSNFINYLIENWVDDSLISYTVDYD